MNEMEPQFDVDETYDVGVTAADWPVDGRSCNTDGCGALVGWVLESTEDSYGAEREGAVWVPTFERGDGSAVCEDCSNVIPLTVTVDDSELARLAEELERLAEGVWL